MTRAQISAQSPAAPASDFGYAVLSYHTFNLGDEIQSIAAAALLPRIDATLDRDDLSLDRTTAFPRYRLILNGWFKQRAEIWPPPPAIEPLILSFHLAEDPPGEAAAARLLTSGANLDYLRRWAPIGARDLPTLKLLEENGIPSFFSSCL